MTTAVGDRVTVFFGVQPFGGSVVEVNLGTVLIRWSDTDTGKPREAWFHEIDAPTERRGRMMGDQTKSVRYERCN